MRIAMKLKLRLKLKSGLSAGLLGLVWVTGGPHGAVLLASPQRQAADAANGQPAILLFVPKEAGAKFSAKNDPNVAMRLLVRDALRESGRYRVITFQANDPIIVRALREHTISAADTVEPISPEAMQRIARAFGVQSILSLSVTQAHDALTTQMRLQESSGGELWHTAYEEKTMTGLMMGRKRLKFDQAIALASDAILTRLGLPSHSDAALRKEKTIQLTKPTKQEKAEQAERIAQEKAKAKADKERAAHTATVTPPDDTTAPTDLVAAAVPSPDPKKSVKPNSEKNSKPGKSASAVPKPDNSTFNSFSTDGAAGRSTAPTRPDVAPPPALAPLDIEAAVARYRQAGDMANVIASLRRAINMRPRDTLLRHQLIQAYVDRQMNDAALEETNRALMLMPDDAGLHRLQGSALLAKGDFPNALQAYRDAIKIDPADVQAQVALADALLTDGQFTEAQSAYQAAVQADPKSPLPHRRLANALARRAVGDATLYTASLDELKQARALTPSADTDAYSEDYAGLARLLEGRLRDLLNEFQNDYQASQQGKLGGNALKTTLSDLKARSEAAADYLDKLPPAAGQDVTHAHYQQGAALLLQAVSLFRDYLSKPEDSTLTAMKGAQADAHRELTAGAKSLLGSKADSAANGN